MTVTPPPPPPVPKPAYNRFGARGGYKTKGRVEPKPPPVPVAVAIARYRASTAPTEVVLMHARSMAPTPRKKAKQGPNKPCVVMKKKM